MKAKQDFYCLSSPLVARQTNPLYGSIDEFRKYGSAELNDNSFSYERIECSLDPTHKRMARRVEELRLIRPTYSTSDFVWTIMSDCIVTDRVLGLFKNAGFTGFQERLASIVKVKGRRKNSQVPVPKVWELAVNGKGGDAHPDSGIRLLYACVGCGLKRYSSFRSGIIVDENQWDGSDFFTVNGYSGFILITERVKDMVIQNGFTNCTILRSRDLHWGDIPRPEDFMSESQVTERRR